VAANLQHNSTVVSNRAATEEITMNNESLASVSVSWTAHRGKANLVGSGHT